MMKTIVIILLWNMISINAYPDQKCYICETSSCIHPAKSDIKDCSDSGNHDGKNFVYGAIGGNSSNAIYDTLALQLVYFGKTDLGLNDTTMPSWNSLTRWVCYVSKDKRRGCLAMAKGFCSEDKGWLGQIGDLGGKISSIIQKAKDAIGKMFPDTGLSAALTVTQKENISNWFAENYMAKLVNNTKEPQYQLDTCCEGNACNSFPSMIPKPTAVLSLLFLSTLIVI